MISVEARTNRSANKSDPHINVVKVAQSPARHAPVDAFAPIQEPQNITMTSFTAQTLN